MASLVRYFEIGDYGEKTGRQLIAKADAELPAPADRANWRIDSSFDLATELLDAPSFKSVLESVLKNGHEIVSSAKGK